MPGQFGHRLHVEAVGRVLEAAAAAGKPVGTMANDIEDGKALLEEGGLLANTVREDGAAPVMSGPTG